MRKIKKISNNKIDFDNLVTKDYLRDTLKVTLQEFRNDLVDKIFDHLDKNFVTNSDIVGQNIQLTFAIPHKFFQGDSCKSKIRDVELRNVYTSEVTIEKPFTLLRIVPDYSSIHREGYGFKTHYNLTMVFEESHTFYQIKILLNSQRGEYSEHGFPKRRLPLELRQFNFLN